MHGRDEALNPLAGRARSQGVSIRRPRSVRIHMLAVLGVVVIGSAACGAAASSSTSSSMTVSAGAASSASPSPVSGASTSSRGLTKDSINVVFPVVSLKRP